MLRAPIWLRYLIYFSAEADYDPSCVVSSYLGFAFEFSTIILWIQWSLVYSGPCFMKPPYERPPGLQDQSDIYKIDHLYLDPAAPKALDGRYCNAPIPLSLCPSVTFSFRTLKCIAVFSRNFAGTWIIFLEKQFFVI